MAFAGGCAAWVVGASVDNGGTTMRTYMILLLERWEGRAGATFDSVETQLVHFTRGKERRGGCIELGFNGSLIQAWDSTKLPGVTLD